jgi:CRP-like cAMP-binding protein
MIGVRPWVALALFALAVSGAGRTLMDVAGRTLLGRVSPQDALGRFLGMLEGSSYAGLAIGSAAAALLVHTMGIRSALIIAGGFLPLLAILLLKPLTAIDLGPLVSRDRLELILGIPMFAPLPPESVERLAAQLEPMAFEGGETVIRQGDVGDRFFLLESGAAEVDVDGVRVATYAPGASFGEIALLHAVPRTATVRVTTASRLMALDRHHFLSVLGDDPKSMAEAERVAAERLLSTVQQQRHAQVPPTAPAVSAGTLIDRESPRSTSL